MVDEEGVVCLVVGDGVGSEGGSPINTVSAGPGFQGGNVNCNTPNYFNDKNLHTKYKSTLRQTMSCFDDLKEKFF